MEDPKPYKKTVRYYYPWDELVEVGMKFVITEPKCVRQLVFAANQKQKKLGTGVRYKHFTEDGVVFVRRIV